MYERIVNVLHVKHYPQVAKSVDRGGAVIGNHGRSEESGNLEPTVTVRCPHHGNLDTQVAQSSDTVRPSTFDWNAHFELKAKFCEELNGSIKILYNNAHIVHRQRFGSAHER
jgi:hypothetical protein